MTDRERLRDKLGKLAAGRTTSGVDARSEPALLKSIAVLVDETVLPRDVTLRAGDATVVLTISRRRLLNVAGDVHADFEEDGEAPLERLRADLVGILVGKGAVKVTAERAEVAPGMQAAGASAEALAAAWGVSLYADEGGVGGLAGLVRAKAYAWVSWEKGAARDEGGDPEYLKVLKKNVSPADLRKQHGGARGMVVVGGHSFTTAIGVAWDGDAEAGFVVAHIDLAPLAKAFAEA